MAQRKAHDQRVTRLIESERIIVDPSKGVVFGAQTDIQGERARVAYKNRNGDHLFSFRWENKTYIAYVCRAIWIKVHGSISGDLVVTHKDGNLDNNSVTNLFLVKHKKYCHHRSWTEKDLNWLSRNYAGKSLSQLANKLGRSEKAVRHKINMLNFPRKKGANQSWSRQENAQILSMYQEQKSIKEIADCLGRTEISVRLQASRKLHLFRSDRHLQKRFRSKNFYVALKSTLSRGTSGSECCLCGYNKYVHLHHVDGNNENNVISNIASLCPNCHTEVEHGCCDGKLLYCTWWRIYSDETFSESMNNKSCIRV